MMTGPISSGPPTSNRPIRSHRLPRKLPSNASAPPPRRTSFSGIPKNVLKAQRTSKTSQKLVVLPSAPQIEPLLSDTEQAPTHGYETDAGVKELKSEAEKMTKEQRKQVS